MRLGLRAVSSRPLRWILGEGALGNQPLNGSDDLVHIHDQDRGAVFHQRGGADVLDLAEPGIERLHDQLAFSQKAVHGQPVARVAVAQHYDRQTVAGRLRVAAIEDLVGGEQTDLLAAELKMMAAFQDFDVLARQLQGAGDLRGGNRVRFAGHLDQ